MIISYYGKYFISYVSRDRRILVEFVHSTSRNLERRHDEHASAVTYYHISIITWIWVIYLRSQVLITNAFARAGAFELVGTGSWSTVSVPTSGVTSHSCRAIGIDCHGLIMQQTTSSTRARGTVGDRRNFNVIETVLGSAAEWRW